MRNGEERGDVVAASRLHRQLVRRVVGVCSAVLSPARGSRQALLISYE